MPPKAKISKDMVVQAAMDVTRECGVAAVNARSVAQRLGCSTQPEMYHFATIDELKRAVYHQVDLYHTERLMSFTGKHNPLLEIGLNYIRFAIDEPHFFRLLFQSGYASENNVLEMIDSPDLMPVLGVMQEGLQMDMQRTKEVFLTIALFAHGYASIIANNALDFDEEIVAEHLDRAFTGAMMAAAAVGDDGVAVTSNVASKENEEA